MKNNNLSGEKKPEMIIDKNGISFVLAGKLRSGKTKAMKEFFEKSMSEASEKIKDLLDVESSRFNKDVVELHGITDLKFNSDNVEIIKNFNHKYQGLVDIYPDEKIWLQTISKDKSL